MPSKAVVRTTVLGLVVGLFVGSPIRAATERQHPDLAPFWVALDDAREGYRGYHRGNPQIENDFRSREDPQNPGQLDPDGLGFDDLVGSYRAGGAYLIRASLVSIITDFKARAAPENPPDLVAEAVLGLQEGLNELMLGQASDGNDWLVEGLRVRYPIASRDLNEPTHEVALRNSRDAYGFGVLNAAEHIWGNPDLLRSRGAHVYSFWVENTVPAGSGVPGELVENEFYRFAELADGYATATLALGRRLFAFGPESEEDNPPIGNFPGAEDLDVDNRDAASEMLKIGAQATYLNALLLASNQTTDDFQRNNGSELQGHIIASNELYRNILAGFNPMEIEGDDIPTQPLDQAGNNNPLTTCWDSVNDAIVLEANAENASREYDIALNTLRTELFNQESTLVGRIESITDLPDPTILLDPIQANVFIDQAVALAKSGSGSGELTQAQFAIDSAQSQMRDAQLVVQQIPERIRIEEQRAGAVAQLVLQTGEQMGALAFASTMAGSVGLVQMWGFPVPFINPGAPFQAMIQRSQIRLASLQTALVEGINSSATIKQFLLEQALAVNAVEQAKITVDLQEARFQAMVAELRELVSLYVLAQQNLDLAYYNNPAYRLRKEVAHRSADESFTDAAIDCYQAAKALEYFWGERYKNTFYTGTDFEAVDGAEEYARAESVFAAKSASAGNSDAGLDEFVDALKRWDLEIRSHRPPAQPWSQPPISLKEDILGLKGGDPLVEDLLFEDFVAQHRESGDPLNPDLHFEFGLGFSTGQLLPFDNLRIESVAIDLIGGEVLVPGCDPATPAVVYLAPGGHATIRTYANSNPAGETVLRTWKLPGWETQRDHALNLTYPAAIDFGFLAPPQSVPLQDLSPAVTQWSFEMDMSLNSCVRLENLEDIKFTFAFNFGQPGPFVWPN